MTFRILGVNAAQSAPLRIDPQQKRPLADGSAALLVDGFIHTAIIEERLSRVRYDGGFKLSARACLESASISPSEVNGYAFSSCCDSTWSSSDAAEYIRTQVPSLEVSARNVVVVDHHSSHASLAFVSAGVQDAPVLVCIIDGMGNRYSNDGDFDISPTWWKEKFQRQTYYIGRWRERRFSLEKVHEEACGVDEIGLGELYRAATHYLGWHSYQYAGKTMALAPFGRDDAYGGLELIRHAGNSMVSTVPNLHNAPCRQISDAFSKAGFSLPSCIAPGDATPGNPVASNVAAVVQRQLEDAILAAISTLADRFGVRHVAFGGGVAMNCVALGKLAKALPQLKFHAPSAPADTGQALGNALFAQYCDRSSLTQDVDTAHIRYGIDRCDFGPRYDPIWTEGELGRSLTLKSADFSVTKIGNDAERAAVIANLLVAGKVIGLRQGKSEYGPRALGHASVIADPRSRAMHDAVNRVKRREPFRPYAPSILAEYVPEWLGTDQYSPFMSFAGWWAATAKDRVPAVVHVDGSARYQSVAKHHGFYRRLIEAFHAITGVPVLLNTSFNQDGEPIVETPADALNAFVQMNLDALVIEDHVIRRL